MSDADSPTSAPRRPGHHPPHSCDCVRTMKGYWHEGDDPEVKRARGQLACFETDEEDRNVLWCMTCGARWTVSGISGGGIYGDCYYSAG